MFIVVRYDPPKGVVDILDTKDWSTESIFIVPLADQLHKSSKLKVYGIRKGVVAGQNMYPLPQCDITICPDDATKAIARVKQKLASS